MAQSWALDFRLVLGLFLVLQISPDLRLLQTCPGSKTYCSVSSKGSSVAKNGVSEPSFHIPASDLAQLNAYLEDKSYLSGFAPTPVDFKLYLELKSTKIPASFTNVVRWSRHIESFQNDLSLSSTDSKDIDKRVPMLDWLHPLLLKQCNACELWLLCLNFVSYSGPKSSKICEKLPYSYICRRVKPHFYVGRELIRTHLQSLGFKLQRDCFLYFGNC